jgi:pyruvate-ferredoxin/flavodoxin oxidoreductase
MSKGLTQQKLAVQSGEWLLYRYNPTLGEQGLNPFTLDSKEPSIPIEEYTSNETRFTMLRQSDAPRAEMLMEQAQREVKARWKFYQRMAEPSRDN